MLAGEERWVRSEEERRKRLGTARRVTDDRWVRSSATEVLVKRSLKSERSGYADKRVVMLRARMGVRRRSNWKKMRGVE